MEETTLPECDYQEPNSVLNAFIAAMNRWEIDAFEASQRASSENPADYQAEVNRRMELIFATYCTPKERKNGRQGSFQHPPQYDPARETIESSSIAKNEKKAFLETNRDAPFGGGNFRYTLLRQKERWLIDSVKRQKSDEETWENTIL